MHSFITHQIFFFKKRPTFSLLLPFFLLSSLSFGDLLTDVMVSAVIQCSKNVCTSLNCYGALFIYFLQNVKSRYKACNTIYNWRLLSKNHTFGCFPEFMNIWISWILMWKSMDSVIRLKTNITCYRTLSFILCYFAEFMDFSQKYITIHP